MFLFFNTKFIIKSNNRYISNTIKLFMGVNGVGRFMILDSKFVLRPTNIKHDKLSVTAINITSNKEIFFTLSSKRMRNPGTIVKKKVVNISRMYRKL